VPAKRAAGPVVAPPSRRPAGRRLAALAERLIKTSDRAEQKRLKEELARMIFGGRRRDGA
jgi:hypothetical protein